MNQEFELIEFGDADWKLPAKRRLRFWMSNFDAEMKAIDRGPDAVRSFWNNKNLRKRRALKLNWRRMSEEFMDADKSDERQRANNFFSGGFRK